MKNYAGLFLALLSLMTLTSCEAVESIFKAGFNVGIFVAVAVVILIIVVFLKFFSGKK